MTRPLISAMVAAFGFALAGCGGGFGHSGSTIPGVASETVGDAAALVAHRPTDSQNAAAAINAVSALGSRIKALAGDGGSAGDDLTRAGPPDSGRGACRGGLEFFAPGRGGDRRSTETRQFFDLGCTRLASDTTRIFRSTGPRSEAVERAIALYAPGRSTPLASRREASRISNATFGRWGFPLVSDGFSTTTTSELWISNQKQSRSKSEIVMLPSWRNVNDFCQDSAGYSLTGIPSLDSTFGWNGGTTGAPLPATRTAGRPGLVTVSSTQRGDTFAGPIGSLSIVASTPNHICPVAAPAYALAGGAPAGAFT
ncbi:MAG: hypothetical protein ABI231_04615, partial [Candidatus Tumulicola sp.]